MDWLGWDPQARWTGHSSRAEPIPTKTTIRGEVDDKWELITSGLYYTTFFSDIVYIASEKLQICVFLHT